MRAKRAARGGQGRRRARRLKPPRPHWAAHRPKKISCAMPSPNWTNWTPNRGEEAVLDARRRPMQGAERIRTDIARANNAIAAEGAEGAMRDALRWLEGASDRAEGKLDRALAALNRALIELGEAQGGVEDCLRQLDFNPAELEALEERLFAIRALARKYGVLPDDLGNHAETPRTRLAVIDGGAAGLAQLQRRVAA